MVLTKNHKTMVARSPCCDTRDFLKSIGTDEEISRFMGDQLRRLSQAFVRAETQREEVEEAIVGIE